MSSFLHLACSTCRVNMVEGGRDAAGWSIFFLLVVILGMLGCIAFFMIRHGKHAVALTAGVAIGVPLAFDPALCDEPIQPETAD